MQTEIPGIEKIISDAVHDANKHNDNEWFPAAEQIAKDALATVLYDRELLEKVITMLDESLSIKKTGSNEVTMCIDGKSHILIAQSIPNCSLAIYKDQHGYIASAPLGPCMPYVGRAIDLLGVVQTDASGNIESVKVCRDGSFVQFA